ncbi:MULTISPECIES: glycosyltransferase family 2 protein [Legionella]|uniref:glycosyltransferase family 2 protein n=1 Tax=Legionella TaxID=445 RepID=UPI000963C134|nr:MULTISPECIES: glycosyltransferase family 2 protein [Legionella]MBN9228578.1 glycosyl transferase [Legionella steelei]OJW08086.1 MAG: glycosyl transferase [Legionella sp. 39-23]
MAEPYFIALTTLYAFVQIIYSLSFLVDLYLYSRPVNWVDTKETIDPREDEFPFIVLFYPVLKEPEGTMYTTMKSFEKLYYPKDRYRIIAIPNSNDFETIEKLRDLQKTFDFLEIMEVPPTDDPSWQIVWDNWSANEKAYWWHLGKHAGVTNLPPKKTRQLIYAFYHIAQQFDGKEDFLVNYVDADTCLPIDHFLDAAVGIRHYDVLQATNIAGNLNQTWPSSFHAFDHMLWDGLKYPHLSANGKHPYWVLGKALYYKASDLLNLGGFHPWMAIEDPEVGMRFWMNGKKLGIIEKPVIEEVPLTFMGGVTQRKRWICGFFQSLTEPLSRLGMSRRQKILAWMNFLPCLCLWFNIIGLPTGVWALLAWIHNRNIFPMWLIILSIINIAACIIQQSFLYYKTWKRTSLVLDNLSSRIWYMFRVNPIFAMFWWFFWLVPITIGFSMYLGEGGLVWIRTTKTNANTSLFKKKVVDWFKKKK